MRFLEGDYHFRIAYLKTLLLVYRRLFNSSQLCFVVNKVDYLFKYFRGGSVEVKKDNLLKLGCDKVFRNKNELRKFYIVCKNGD